MKTAKILFVLVALAATVPAPAAPTANQRPQVVIIVDYAPEVPAGRPHLFRSVREYLYYFAPFFRPCWP
jgi:hypothetical protein